MKEIKNADGSRNWEANILLDNIKRLEQENAELKAYKNKYYQQTLDDEIKLNELYQTLQEIKETAEQSNVDCIYRISVIRKILTKAEEE